MKKIITTFALLIGMTGFAQSDWNQITKNDFTINYPEDWISSDQKQTPATQFLILADEKSQESDNFRENINLNLEDLSGKNISLEAYVKLSLEQITGQIPSAKFLENKAVTINQQEAHSIIWTANFGTGINVKFKQVFLIHKEKAYILTFTSTASDFDDYSSVSDTIINSFKFTN